MLEYALKYHKAGLVVVPAYRADSGRVTFPKGWSSYGTDREQSEQEVRRMFSGSYWGLAIVCTDGMEVIDIDTKADPTKKIADEYFDEIVFSSDNEKLLSECTKVKTKSDGYHLIYRTNNPGGNTKLTIKPGSPEAVIETRGVGGLIFAAPTPGYKVLQGTYEDIKMISDSERDCLIGAAKRLSVIEPLQLPRELEKKYPSSPIESTPWDDFNQKNDVRDLIEQHGWSELPRLENSKYHYYNKPGSSSGEIHGVVVKGENIFFTFTTATVFQEQKGYTPYAVLAMLEHSGDFSACARDLVSRGFGARPEKPQIVEAVNKGKEDTFAQLEATRFDFNAQVKEEPATLLMHHNGRSYKIGGQGMIGGVLGPKKSGKFLLTALVMASRLSGKKKLVYEYISQGKKVLYFDTEQSSFFFHRTQRFIFEMAGYRDNSPAYEAYHLRRASVKERIAFIEKKIYESGPVELIVIDGVVDLCENFNDETASAYTIQKLMEWSDRSGAMLLTVLHTTKVGGYAQGHLGSTLEKKYDFGFTVSKDEETHVFRAKHRDSRFAPFPSFEFERDEKGFPFMDGPFDAEDPPDELPYNPIIAPLTKEEITIPF